MPNVPLTSLAYWPFLGCSFPNASERTFKCWSLGQFWCRGQQTMTAVLRIVDWSHAQHFQTYHRVLNRAVWSSWWVRR